ncbi:MAG: LPS export ABC transporter periplasmic protein LptC [Bacteroidetes bacterium]|nr:LPS export ABC transporter periplasmic protein LptC [Bacteroidota bacterium]
MQFFFKYKIMLMVTVFTVTMFFSCKNNFKDIQNIGILDSGPLSIAENINMKYTDSGKLKSHLISPKMLNYSNREFPFYEFPEGINLTLFDDDNNKSNVVSDYAILYNETDLIDLQGNVILTTHNNDTLYAEQLFYDQKTEWLFTNLPVRFVTNERIINGNGFDSNKDFTQAHVLETTGIIYINDN